MTRSALVPQALRDLLSPALLPLSSLAVHKLEAPRQIHSALPLCCRPRVNAPLLAGDIGVAQPFPGQDTTGIYLAPLHLVRHGGNETPPFCASAKP